MAHVVGVPKRDPCRKCQLPVFLAERLTVGKKVYHRTCLKCARCGYQLTPGSFYETEIDEQYCCETCPDEEVTKKSMEEVSTSSDAASIYRSTITKGEPNVMSVRSSIKDRLAFFENNRGDEESEPKLLEKSLSDEEKSKSLQRTEKVLESSEISHKSNIALSKFLNNIVDDEEDPSTSISEQNSKMETSDSEDDTDSLSVTLPPELPKSSPPLTLENKPEESKRFSVSAQLVLSTSPSVPIYEKNDDEHISLGLPVKENQTSDLAINHLSHAIDNTNNNNINDEEHKSAHAVKNEYISELQNQTDKETVILRPKKLGDSLEFSETNDNDCVTKDTKADEAIAEDFQYELDDRDTRKTRVDSLIETAEIQENPDNESIDDGFVELRTKTENKNPSAFSDVKDNKISERLSLVHARLQQFEVITNNNKEETNSSKHLQENVARIEISSNEENNTLKLIKSESADAVTDEKIAINLVNEEEIEKQTKITFNEDKVPLEMESKDNATLGDNLENKKEHLEKKKSNERTTDIQVPRKLDSKNTIEGYPEALNPFKSDDEDEDLASNKEIANPRTSLTSPKKDNLNPFDSSDDEVELEKIQKSRTSLNSPIKVPPPRPPPPRISKNPFGSEDENETSSQNFTRRSSLTGSQSRKTPVPTPRSNVSQSQNPTPEPTPRLSTKVTTVISNSSSTTPNNTSLPILQNSSEFYGSTNSLYSNNGSPYNLLRNSDIRSSNNSLNLSAGGTIRSRKSRRAPLPPATVKELFPSNETINSSSKASTPSSSIVGTPKSSRKKRPAPAPPKPARLEPSHVPQTPVTVNTQPKNLNNYPLQSELDSKLSDEEKVLLEGKILQSLHSGELNLSLSPSNKRNSKRLISLDQELLEEHGTLQHVGESNSHCDDLKEQNQQKVLAVYEEEPTVVYRRILIPQNLETPTHEKNLLIDHISKSPFLGERQLEKLKDNKEANNRNRQSQISVTSSGGDDNEPLFNKSAHGKWKRRKGPAPALPVPPRKILQMLPLQEIKHELEIIEVQQQGLEKQGVILEKMIRDRCEGENGEPLNASGLPDENGDSASGSSTVENSKEVENLILQLFELVNEKNELFRRQAELMYLRRQHRLEQEQADLEYEIRILMAQPERNKTDSDKAREEALIERLVEVVQLRNEVVECLEMDRLREAEEDQSIKQRLESHIAKRDDTSNVKKTPTKLSKKEKKKQKEGKKLSKNKKIDADKDADESELNVDKLKSKRKKKLLIF